MIFQKKKLNIEQFCKECGVHIDPFKVFIRTLATVEILNNTDTDILQGKNFKDVFSNKGYFVWLVKGYAHTIENMSMLLKMETLKVSNVQRNGGEIAKAGKDYGYHFVNSHFNQVFDAINPTSIADFGCGSADRLIGMVKKNNNLKGIGIDINADAVNIAKDNIRAAGLEDKIQVICADISTLKNDDRFRDTELIFSFFMGHDLFPKENCKAVFSQIQKVFPKATTFLLCDTYSSESIKQPPIFTLGFELTHALMGQVIPTYKDWIALFKELDWTLVNTIDIDIPFSTIFNLKIR